jgi:hypothetical protein
MVSFHQIVIAMEIWLDIISYCHINTYALCHLHVSMCATMHDQHNINSKLDIFQVGVMFHMFNVNYINIYEFNSHGFYLHHRY